MHRFYGLLQLIPDSVDIEVSNDIPNTPYFIYEGNFFLFSC
jgi:hypothetical protein